MIRIIPDENLSHSQLAALLLVRAINKRNARAHGVYAADIPPASDRVRTAGVYSIKEKEIYMVPDQLDHGKDAIDTGIHEMGHHISKAEDGDSKHDEQIKLLSQTIIDQVNQGDYDEYLKNPELSW
jgi:predicted SprT family Zn-dependent metalloprotease